MGKQVHVACSSSLQGRKEGKKEDERVNQQERIKRIDIGKRERKKKRIVVNKKGQTFKLLKKKKERHRCRQ